MREEAREGVVLLALRTRLGDVTVSASDDGEHKDVYVDLCRPCESGRHEFMRVCVVTVDGDGLHVYPYNTGDPDDTFDCATDDIIVRTDGDRWYH